MQQTEKYWKLITLITGGAITIMLVVGIVLMFVPKVHQINKYQNKNSQLQEEIAETVADEKELREKQLRFRSDPAFVEKVAHEVGYAHKNEKIYLFPEETSPTNEPAH